MRNVFKLFKSTFILSAFTFGGGYVIIPLMRKRFVEELGWIEEEEMINAAAIAQSSPGPIAVNASIILGWRIMGLPGMLVSMIGTVLPPFITLSVISMFYSSFMENEVAAAVLKGMTAGVGAVIFDVVITMGGSIIKLKKFLPIFILAAVFTAYYILRINIVYIILFSGIVGALSYTDGEGKKKA